MKNTYGTTVDWWLESSTSSCSDWSVSCSSLGITGVADGHSLQCETVNTYHFSSSKHICQWIQSTCRIFLNTPVLFTVSHLAWHFDTARDCLVTNCFYLGIRSYWSPSLLCQYMHLGSGGVGHRNRCTNKESALMLDWMASECKH